MQSLKGFNTVVTAAPRITGATGGGGGGIGVDMRAEVVVV